MLTVYTLEQAEQWDKVVHTFKNYDIYWLSGYVKAFQLHGDGEPLLFYYDDINTRGINVVMKRDIAKDDKFSGKIPENTYFDLATPYGYGCWLIEGEEVEALFASYDAWLNDNGIISEFIRFHPMLQNHKAVSNYYDVVQLGEVVHMDLSSPEVIWNNITSKNRNMIRKAIKNDIKIYQGRFPEIYNKFREIYDGTMDKDNADSYYYFKDEFYASLLNDLPVNAQVFYAVKDNEIIAASIILAANGRLNYHLSGSLKEYSTFAPTNLLLYQVALWGCENGFNSLYLGGGVGSGEDGLLRFKKSFYKGDKKHFFIGKRVCNKEKYKELVNLRTDIVNESFFPKYRG